MKLRDKTVVDRNRIENATKIMVSVIPRLSSGARMTFVYYRTCGPGFHPPSFTNESFPCVARKFLSSPTQPAVP